MMVLYHLYNGTAIVVLSVFVLETRQNEGQVQPITSRIWDNCYKWKASLFV